MKRSFMRVLIATLSIACLLALNSQFEPHFDFNSFWGAGRALLQGRNPYDYAVIQDILYPRATANFNYPLYIAPLIVPLALFNLETAKNIWLTVSEILLVMSIYLISGRLPRSRDFVLSTLACAIFVPTLIALFDQQTSMFALFLVSLVYYGLRRDQHVLAGVALALSLIKPQTVALLVLLTLFQLNRQGLVTFTVTFALLLAVAFGLMLEWPVHWWASASWITQEAGRAVPTIWGLSWVVTSGYWLGGALFLGLLGTVLLNTSFPFVLTVGLLLPVYMKPYDLVLLFVPALSRPGRRLLGSLVIGSYVLLSYAAISGRGGDIFILLTIITFGYLLHQDAALMTERIHRCRFFVKQRLGL